MNKLFTLITGGLVLSTNIFSQNLIQRGTEDTLRNKMVTIVTYRPTIADAKKINESPSIIDTIVAKPKVRYMYDNEQFKTTYLPDTIKAAKMKGEPLEPLYRGYSKVGVGNGINYLADIHINTLRSRKSALGFKLNGFGTQGNFMQLPHPAPYSHWTGALTGKKFLKKHSIEGSIGYDREQIMYYGFDDTNPYYFDLPQEKVFNQNYHDWTTSMSLKSFFTDSSKINHKIDFNYHFWSDKYQANTEHNAVIKGNINTYFGEHNFDLDAIVDGNFVNYANQFVYQPFDTIQKAQNNFIVNLHPKLTSQYKKLKVEVGLQLQAEFGQSGSTPYVYPNLNARYNLVKEIIIPYASLNGGFGRKITRTNLNSLSDQNPFVWINALPLANAREVYNVGGGFRGTFTKRFTYNIYAKKYKIENVPLFINYNASQYNEGVTRFGENYFLVNYDTVATTEIGGEITYRIDNKFQFLGSGIYRAYAITNELKAWQMPIFELHGSAQYTYRKKFIFKSQAHIFGPRWTKSYDSNDEFVGYQNESNVYGKLLPSIFDISLGAEYRYTDRISGFVTFNNLIAQQYQYWNQFQAQRFNILFGATVSFWKE